tara:strand:- start:1033 stop:1206 length:174 start_codon:yes stop_codon:yes gene_type:complete
MDILSGIISFILGFLKWSIIIILAIMIWPTITLGDVIFGIIVGGLLIYGFVALVNAH